MTDATTPPAEHSSSPNIATRIGWTLLILATLYVCYFSHLGAIGFVGPDEPRYAWIARDMAETGDWITPRLYGRPWFEKPVLYYWGAALSFKLFGISEAAARLPSAVSALLATLALAWLAWRIYGAETARWLLLLLPTTVGMIGFSHAAATDMPFSAMLTIAMVCAAVILGLTRKDAFSPLPSQSHLRPKPHFPWLALILFGFFLGAAVLAKGPAAIILCGGAVFLWVLFTRRLREAFRLTHPIAIISFCLTALPWYILCARRNPDFLRIFIIEHNFKRYLTPEFQHIQPFWYYIPIFALALIPCTALLAGLSKRTLTALRENEHKRPTNLLFVCLAVFTIFFFSISKSKLPGYILPAVPAAALILTRIFVLTLKTSNGRFQRIGLSSGVLLVGLGMAGIFLFPRFASGQDIVPASWQMQFIFLAIAGGIVTGALGFLKKTFAAQITVIIVILLLVAIVNDALSFLDYVYSPRYVPNAARGELHAGFSPDQAVVFDVSRGIYYGLNFYFRREFNVWSTTNSGANPEWVLTRPQSSKKLEQLGFKCDAHRYAVAPAVIFCKAPDKPSGQQSQ